jgi:hypothetical protein
VPKSLRSSVKEILDDLDAEELLAIGAPTDEYLSDAQDFAERLVRGETMTAELVQTIWVGRFYPDCGLLKKNLAGQLAAALNELERPPLRSD